MPPSRFCHLKKFIKGLDSDHTILTCTKAIIYITCGVIENSSVQGRISGKQLWRFRRVRCFTLIYVEVLLHQSTWFTTILDSEQFASYSPPPGVMPYKAVVSGVSLSSYSVTSVQQFPFYWRCITDSRIWTWPWSVTASFTWSHNNPIATTELAMLRSRILPGICNPFEIWVKLLHSTTKFTAQ